MHSRPAWGESLESRYLLAAPVARDDAYAMNEDSVLVTRNGGSAWAASTAHAQPLHWFRFEETSGALLQDEGSAGIDGTLGGVVALGRPGAVGRAAYFNGGGFVRLGEPALAGSVEAIAAVEPDHSYAQSLLGAATSSVAGGSAVALRVSQWPQLNTLGYTQYRVADWDSGVASPIQLTHIAWVGSDRGVDIYVSGALVAHFSTAVPLSRYVIGAGHLDASGQFANEPFAGTLDELAIYDRALSATEIAQHAQSMQADVSGHALAPEGVLANDTDADGDALTAVVDTPPAHGQFNFLPSGDFTYTPDTNFHGADGFTYHIADGNGGTHQATVSLQVNATNDIPVAFDDRDAWTKRQDSNEARDYDSSNEAGRPRAAAGARSSLADPAEPRYEFPRQPGTCASVGRRDDQRGVE